MGEHVVSRSAMRVDDPFGIPACFYWTVDEVADWVDSIGYGKYKENFRSHFINGRKLLTVDSCVLPKMGITHFGDILALTKQIRDQLHIKKDVSDINIYAPHKRGAYIGAPHPSGTLRRSISYQQHLRQVEPIIDARQRFFKKRNICYSGWTMDPSWDQKLKKEERRHNTTIGTTLQERLREAALREVSYKEHTPSYRCYTSRMDPGRRYTYSFLTADPSVRRPSHKKEKGRKPKSGPHLPIVFHWRKMETTTGYPQIVDDRKNEC